MTSQKRPDTSEYDKFGDFYFDFVKSGRLDLVTSATVDVVGTVEKQRVCDLACGEGHLSRTLADAGATVTGVDVSVNLLAHARRQSTGMGIEFIHDDAERLSSLRDDSFDIVVCHMSLMDIADLEQVYGAVWRVLKDDGLFVFSILHPCFEAPFAAKEGLIEVDDDDNFVAVRINRYTEEGKWYSGGTGMRGRLGSVHRTLATYVNTLLAAGFELTGLAEPTLPAGEYERKGEQWASKVPRYLIVRAVKRPFPNRGA